ncbi:hypothetical protein ACRTDU_09390 [Sunxiuqinia elliptica]
MNYKQLNSSIRDDLRQKAEKQVNEKHLQIVKPNMSSEEKKLLREVQILQIILEMQNEELQQTNEVVEKALKKYTMLFDFAPIGYFILDAEGLICDLNFTGAEMLGEKRFSFLKTDFKLFISKESHTIFSRFFERIFHDAEKVSCKITLGYNDRLARQVYLEGLVIENEQECLLSVIDISHFKN